MKKMEYVFINIGFAALFFIPTALFLMQGAEAIGSIAWWIKTYQPHSIHCFVWIALLPFYIASTLLFSSIVGFYLGRFMQRRLKGWRRILHGFSVHK